MAASLAEAFDELEKVKGKLAAGEYEALKRKMVARHLGVRPPPSDAEQNAMRYMQRHGIAAAIDTALKHLFAAQPPDPLSFLSRHFAAAEPAAPAPTSLAAAIGGAPAIDALVEILSTRLATRNLPSLPPLYTPATHRPFLRTVKQAFLAALSPPGSIPSPPSLHRLAKAQLSVLLDCAEPAVHKLVRDEATANAVLKAFEGLGLGLGGGKAVTTDKGTIPTTVDSLYDRLGGAAGVETAVDLFYAKVLADSLVGGFFKAADMPRLKRMQRAFLTLAFGGPTGYSGASLRLAHWGLVNSQGLSDAHYDVVVNLLDQTLQDLNAAASDIAEAVRIANSVRDDVLCKDEPKTTLFESLGGAPAVSAAVDKFYAKVLADPRVNTFFDKVDMRKQRTMQKAFFTFAFGGPAKYNGRSMRDAHRTLVKDKGLSDVHFDAIVELLGQTLKELGVSDSDIAGAAEVANSVRNDVLCKSEKLYDRLGGAAAVNAAVDKFFAKVLADPRVNSFFDNVDMQKQRTMMKVFLTFAFGGPGKYNGRSMRDAHRVMVKDKGLSDSHYDVIVSLLGQTLKELGVPASDVREAAAIANSVRDDVLCKGEDLKETLFARLGGAAAVNAAVDKFYAKVLADARVSHFFDKVDMKKQRAMQKAFFTFAFGGPAQYNGRSMREAHRALVKDKGLSDVHYDAIVSLLGQTLKELGVADCDVAAAAAVANSVRDDVLCKGETVQKRTLYDRLGGAPAVSAAVDKFYAKVLADARVNSFFDNVDMKKQRAMQKAFFTFAFGGPGKYNGRSMRDAHRSLVKDRGLSDVHFDAIVELLCQTLKELGVSDSDIAGAAEVANSVRNDVLCKSEKLYDRLGGAATVNAAVDKFYAKVLADARVSHFFDNVDMKKQRTMQKAFLTFAFGGPANNNGRSMRDAHRNLVKVKGLSDAHYDTIVSLLGQTLKELGAADGDVSEVAQVANSVRDDVLCKGETAQKKTLYDRLGGANAVNAAVDKFYAKVLADARVNSFFDSVDMKKQRTMQKAFLTFAFGGPAKYNGRSMRDANRELVKDKGLSDVHFDAIVELLGQTLKELGVPANDVLEVVAIANSVRDDILCKGEPIRRPLFDRLGGAAAVNAAVDKFYEKVLADSRVKHFFVNVDMKKQRTMQKAFLTFAFGGPGKYNGRSMRDAHRPLVKEKGLSDSHFDAIVELLGQTLKDLGVPASDIAEVALVANSVRDDILCKSEGDAKGSLFDRLGGAAAVNAAVDKFYEKVLVDSRVKHFFDNVDMRKQRSMQKAFLTFAFGGPAKYSGRSMRDAHRALVQEKGLSDYHYDAIVELLGETLKDVGAAASDIADVAVVANSVRDDILCKGEKGEDARGSLFDRLGGAAAVSAAVDKFYQKIMADPRIRHFFDNVNMKKQQAMQKAFLTFAFGGPAQYSGRLMREAHRPLVQERGLSDVHFEAVVELLVETLKELGVATGDISAVVEVTNSVRDDILCKGEAKGSLFDRLGGAAAVNATVNRFYQKVLADPRVNYFFATIDMKKQRAMQKGFLTFAFGGPGKYNGRSMRNVHRPLVKEKGLSDVHFDAIMELLGHALRELGVSASDISEVADVVNSVRGDVLCTGEDDASGSLFDRLGGAAAVNAAVDKFYEKVLADSRVKHFFDNVDMRKQRSMQKAFLTFAFGGPGKYNGRSMRDAHRPLVKEKGLSDSHYDAIVELLAQTLKELGVPASDIADVAVVANSVRDDVLCRGEDGRGSLYDRLGGAAAVRAAVDKFYEKVLADPRVRRFFDGVDMQKQRTMQTAFLTFALGGPANYTGRSMRDAHRTLVTESGLSDVHFDAILEHLTLTLKELGVGDRDVEEAIRAADSTRADVLCKGEEFAGSGQKAKARVLTPAEVEVDVKSIVLDPAALAAAATALFNRMDTDSFLRPFTVNTPAARQRSMLRGIFSTAVPADVLPRLSHGAARNAHRRLVADKKLGPAHFDAFAMHLEATLRSLRVTRADTAAVLNGAHGLREAVLCLPPGQMQAQLSVGTPLSDSRSDDRSLFERLGGDDGMQRAVPAMHQRILSDRKVKHFFIGVGMASLRSMQIMLLSLAFGKPGAQFLGSSMANAHRRLVQEMGLEDCHFDKLVGILRSVLLDIGAAEQDADEAAALVELHRDDVMGRGIPEDSIRPAARRFSADRAAIPGDADLAARLGGAPKLRTVALSVLSALSEHPSTTRFMVAAPTQRLAGLLTEFFLSVFGDVPFYGKNLRVAHQRAVNAGLGDAHFDIFLDIFCKRLAELGHPADIIDGAKEILEEQRDDVLCKPE
ncbi:Group 1 truncated hemoglobin GlbN [Diplonema papillatum]|nr:Group 1 truncated hemoglobin GlbN [Diplonema papillatum]